MAETTAPADYEKNYDEFWKGLIEKDGHVNLDQIKRELFDFHTLMRNAGEVYCHVTGSQVSKVNTDPAVVTSIADDILNRNIQEAVAESMSVVKIDTAAVQHFLRLASKGRIGAASGGEKRANRIAKLLPKVLDDVPGLDDTAIRGIVGLLQGASGAYETVVDLLAKAGFES